MQIILDERESEQLLRLAVLGAYIVANGGGVCEETSGYKEVKEKLIRGYLREKGAGPALTELQAALRRNGRWKKCGNIWTDMRSRPGNGSWRKNWRKRNAWET